MSNIEYRLLGFIKKYSSAIFLVVALMLTACILGIILLWVLKNGTKTGTVNLITLLHVTVYTCVLFLPTMHERYGYI